ncbi:hypothetical protein [Spirosoma flavus]
MSEPQRIAPGAEVLLRGVSQFTTYPPEKLYMQTAKSDITAWVIQTIPSSGRIGFMPANFD